MLTRPPPPMEGGYSPMNDLTLHEKRLAALAFSQRYVARMNTCEICYAYDGGGKSEIGSGQYRQPPDPPRQLSEPMDFKERRKKSRRSEP
jgi:hypothetical protein